MPQPVPLKKIKNKLKKGKKAKKVQVYMETSTRLCRVEKRQVCFCISWKNFYLSKNVKTDKAKTQIDPTATSMLCNSTSVKYLDIFIPSGHCVLCTWQYFTVEVSTRWQIKTEYQTHTNTYVTVGEYAMILYSAVLLHWWYTLWFRRTFFLSNMWHIFIWVCELCRKFQYGVSTLH